MSRNRIPSIEQQEMLIEYLEEKPWLATGYSRTANARDRTRAGWAEVANKLNSDGRGALKTWQQWSKYWKDKKASVKRKYSSMRIARKQTGGGAADVPELSMLDDRVLGLMGGDRAAIGDRDLEINPFHTPMEEEEPDPVAMNSAGATVHPNDTYNTELNIEDHVVGSDTTAVSQSILEGYHGQHMMSECEDLELNDNFSRVQRAGPHAPCSPRAQSSNTQNHSDATTVSVSILQGYYDGSMYEGGAVNATNASESQFGISRGLDIPPPRRPRGQPSESQFSPSRGRDIMLSQQRQRGQRSESQCSPSRGRDMPSQHTQRGQRSESQFSPSRGRDMPSQHRQRGQRSESQFSPSRGRDMASQQSQRNQRSESHFSPSRGRDMPSQHRQRGQRSESQLTPSRSRDMPSQQGQRGQRSVQWAGQSSRRAGSHAPCPPRDQSSMENAQIPTPPNPSAPQPSTASSPRRQRRLLTTRVMRGCPPSQRHSEMTSLTERFVALEERRIDIEVRRQEGQDSLVGVLRTMSEAWVRQSQSLQDMATALKDMASRLTRE